MIVKVVVLETHLGVTFHQIFMFTSEDQGFPILQVNPLHFIFHVSTLVELTTC